ncbi:hypothetical protein ACWC4A_22430 [Streptomyces mirabilis]|uniref:hypothetical protein n=1 Tax=Streptomyces TaxID=1883 RepID=UPI0011632D48|nr:hypothetical protein [Streptomyces sp. S1A1-7]QDN76943.1 hypothetical protein FNV64_16405 [Streptomyces sp. S1A1-7]
MRSKTTRLAGLLVTLALLSAGAGAVTGCGSERAAGSGVETPGTGQEPRAESRARQVTDAWDGSEAARQRRRGYHPMAEGAPPPAGRRRATSDRATGSAQPTDE